MSAGGAPGGCISGWFDVHLGCFGFSSWIPSCYGSNMGGRRERVVSSVLGMCLLKSVSGLLPRYMPLIGHRPPFVD